MTQVLEAASTLAIQANPPLDYKGDGGHHVAVRIFRRRRCGQAKSFEKGNPALKSHICGVSAGGAAYFIARQQPSLQLDPNTAFFVALVAAGLACWLIIERPMKQIEKRLPLYDDDA
jgi:hypothetical protein